MTVTLPLVKVLPPCAQWSACSANAQSPLCAVLSPPARRCAFPRMLVDGGDVFFFLLSLTAAGTWTNSLSPSSVIQPSQPFKYFSSSFSRSQSNCALPRSSFTRLCNWQRYELKVALFSVCWMVKGKTCSMHGCVCVCPSIGVVVLASR